MIRCKVYDVEQGYMFDYECERVPENDTVFISQDGRYLRIVSIRRRLKYHSEAEAYRDDDVDIMVSDYGPIDEDK